MCNPAHKNDVCSLCCGKLYNGEAVLREIVSFRDGSAGEKVMHKACYTDLVAAAVMRVLTEEVRTTLLRR